MKRAILAQLAKGPATLGDLQRALGVPSSPAHRRGVLLNRLKALAAEGAIWRVSRDQPWYELRTFHTSRLPDGRFAPTVDKP